MTALLCVCLGNICRSPLAEAILRQQAAQLGLDLIVDSAGTGNWHVGKAPDKRSVSIARHHGLDITGQRARQVSIHDFRKFTHILAMDSQNLADLRALAPGGHGAQLSLMLDHAAHPRWAALRDVPDPYYGGQDGFAEVFEMLSDAAAGFLNSI